MSEEIYFKNTFLSQKNKLYRFAFFFLKETDEAKDATQETLIKIWDKREEWHKVENPDAWSMQIIKNNCLDRLRKTKTVQKHQANLNFAQSTDQNPGTISIWQDQWKLLQQVLNQLSDKQKAVFILREIEGNSYQEIAESLEISEAQVKSDLFRSRKYLKETMLKINNHGIGTTRTMA
nr:RNA polymerase sigma factor [Marivirga aurantiaca]